MKQRSEQLYDVITEISEDLILEAEEKRGPAAAPGQRKKKPHRTKWAAAIAAVLALALLAGSTLRSGQISPPSADEIPPFETAEASPNETAPGLSHLFDWFKPLTAKASTISEAQYPEMAPYPDETDYVNQITGTFDHEGFDKVYRAWREDLKAQRNQPEGYAAGLEAFFADSAQTFLANAGSENRVYSPINVYMALGMLAELTDGDSRQQILDLIGTADLATLREQARALWNANYCADGATTSVLASSLWLNEDVNFVQDTMDTLADTYYASSYQGEMGSDPFNQALQTWLNDQTGGLLEEQAGNITMDPDTILALATTIYFQAKWDHWFSENKTYSETFHTPTGDATCDFMHQSGTSTYYWGDKFGAVQQRFVNDGAMWFLLPDEGVSVDELLSDPQVMEFMLADGDWEDQKQLVVNLSVPKFDVSSDLDLCDGLKKLGIVDVFDPNISDFTPMTTDRDDIFLSQAKHAARVAIDEEGCTAAAFTVMALAGAGMPPDEEIDFVLDRPFLFVITGATGQPLFVGVVNQP